MNAFTAALLEPRAALIHGRNTDVFAAGVIAPKSVDLILTDPPYSEHTHANLGKERRKDGTKAREALRFPPLTDAEIAEHAARYVALCKGWILVNTDDRSVNAWGTAIERAGGRWVRTGHWVKTNPTPQMTGDRPSVGTEPLVMAHADPDFDEGYPELESYPVVIGHAFPPGKGKMQWTGGGRAALWRGPGPSNAERFHPNQKPLWFLQELIGLFCPGGGVVLDPFAGSASTGVAALATRRFPGSKTKPDKLPPIQTQMSFVGIEGDPLYVEPSVARLRRALEGDAS